MTKLCVILPDQLSLNISSLEHIDPEHDIVMMCETYRTFTDVKHHKKKIAFILSAMRHFHLELKKQFKHVIYYTLDPDVHTLSDILPNVHKKHDISDMYIMQPANYSVLQELEQLAKTLPIHITSDNHFLCDIETFKNWAGARKQLRMEFFYRMMRKKYQILMNGAEPYGGKWNFDADNRKKAPANLEVPIHYKSEPDQISLEAMKLVETHFKDHFGDLEPFYFAVTRKQALVALQQFISERLSLFGDYQDAMVENEPFMYHSHISFYLNCGMLTPLECIHAAQDAYTQHQAPLNAVEGFIRQILGWREFIRGIYWLKMPAYKTENFFNNQHKLPSFYWDANTDMNCIKQCVTETKQNAYAHHIQRLMVLGNFALIAGIDPKYVNEWYLIVYADAYEWVELPNVSGMALFADGGLLGSKPYASSGAYINKMSNYCKGCKYNLKTKDQADSCPFNYLYWDFLIRNKDVLEKNQRMSFMYNLLQKMDPKVIKNLQQQADDFLSKSIDSS